MAEYIDRILLGEAVTHGMVHYEDIMSVPTADVVERKVLDQVYWERDTALHQLAEIGKGLGEKMDDVVCLDLSPMCVGCDGKTADGETTDLCDYKTTYKRCFEQGKKLVDIAKAYFNGELVKRKHGKWTLFENDIEQNAYECSVCNDVFVLLDGTPQDNLYNFCPNCGADLKSREGRRWDEDRKFN